MGSDSKIGHQWPVSICPQSDDLGRAAHIIGGGDGIWFGLDPGDGRLFFLGEPHLFHQWRSRGWSADSVKSTKTIAVMCSVGSPGRVPTVARLSRREVSVEDLTTRRLEGTRRKENLDEI